MGRPCSICAHPERRKLERSILRGEPLTRVASRTSLKHSSLRRHLKDHVTPRLIDSERLRDVAISEELIEELHSTRREAWEIYRDARSEKRDGLALRALARVDGSIELEARLLGQIKDRQTNVFNLGLDAETAARMADTFLRRHGAINLLPAPVAAVEGSAG